MKITCSVNSASVEMNRIHIDEFKKLDDTIKGMPIFWAIDKEGRVLFWPNPSDEVLMNAEIRARGDK